MKLAIKTILIALALCVVIELAWVLLSQCPSFDAATAKTNDEAQQWMHLWTGDFDWPRDHLERGRWQPVIPAKISAAESALFATSSVLLTDTEANDFTGQSSPRSAPRARPYLLRAVVPAKHDEINFIISIRQNTDIWIGSVGFGHCPIPMRRQPIVAWLDNQPHEVFITLNVTE
jgi:hypothetical protein